MDAIILNLLLTNPAAGNWTQADEQWRPMSDEPTVLDVPAPADLDGWKLADALRADVEAALAQADVTDALVVCAVPTMDGPQVLCSLRLRVPGRRVLRVVEVEVGRETRAVAR